ncbi:hypothetical protein Tco_1218264 [Tanacetum coccineum]
MTNLLKWGTAVKVGNGGKGGERWGMVAKVRNDDECGYEGAMVVKMKLKAGERVGESTKNRSFSEEVVIFCLRVRSLLCLFVKGAYGCILVGNGGEGGERWGMVAKVGNDDECGYEGAMVVKMKLEAGGRVGESTKNRS